MKAAVITNVLMESQLPAEYVPRTTPCMRGSLQVNQTMFEGQSFLLPKNNSANRSSARLYLGPEAL